MVNDIRGRTVVALHKSGACFDIHLEVMETFDDKTRRRMFSARVMMDTSASVDRRCIKARSMDRTTERSAYSGGEIWARPQARALRLSVHSFPPPH